MLCPQETGKMESEVMQLAGLGVLCVRLPTAKRGARRRLTRAVKWLRRAGVKRLLPCRGYRPDVPLAWVEELPLYRALADRLVLAALDARGVPPRCAAVVLRGEYPDGDLTAAAYRLCPKVRQVVVDTRRGGEALQNRLYREFGITVGPMPEGTAVFRVCFGGAPAGEELQLCQLGTMPECGLYVPEIQLPSMLEREPALCALWQCGRLNLSRIRIVGGDGGNNTP